MQHRNPSQYSTNPQTGLPEFGFFSSIGNIVRSVTNAAGLTSKSSSPAAPAGTPAAASAGTSSAPAGTPGASAPATALENKGNLKPREWFDDPNAVDYLSRYSDVAADPLFSQNPYLHYTTYGKNEGKTWGGTSSAATAQAAAAPAQSQSSGANAASNSTVSGGASAGQESGGSSGGGASGTPSYATSQYMGANAIKQAAQAVSGPYDQQSEAKLDEAVMAAAKEEQVNGVKFVTPFSYVDEYGNLNSKEMETPFSDAASNARRGQWGSTVQV